MSERDKLHTFVVYVDDKPGVLNRIASLFRRRAFNIESLTVGHTELPGVSRMTIVSRINEGAAHRVEANIYKLVNVLAVHDVTHGSTVARSLALIKVRAREESRRQLMEIIRVFRARVVDLAPESLIIESTGAEERIEALVGMLRPFGILEMARTGRLAMTRGVERSAGEVLSPEAARDPRQKSSAQSVEASHSV
jgi:acetolactate synthase-1/3 small subunit